MDKAIAIIEKYRGNICGNDFMSRVQQELLDLILEDIHAAQLERAVDPPSACNGCGLPPVQLHVKGCPFDTSAGTQTIGRTIVKRRFDMSKYRVAEVMECPSCGGKGFTTRKLKWWQKFLGLSEKVPCYCSFDGRMGTHVIVNWVDLDDAQQPRVPDAGDSGENN